MNPMDLAWRLFKKQYVPEWHLKQRFPKGKPITEVKPWKRMPRPPKARTTHGFHGEPIPTNEEILDNPPVAVPDVTEHTDEEWWKRIQMRMADDENAEVVPEFSPEFQDFYTGEPMDLSWRLLKEGSYQTKFWSDDPNEPAWFDPVLNFEGETILVPRTKGTPPEVERGRQEAAETSRRILEEQAARMKTLNEEWGQSPDS